MDFLPLFSNGNIADGVFIHMLPFCAKHCQLSKCSAYYSSIQDQGGFHSCPYGLTSFVDIETGLIYTGFRDKMYYKKDTEKRFSNDDVVYNPVLQHSQVIDLVNISKKSYNDEIEVENKRIIVEGISHEAKKLNVNVKIEDDKAGDLSVIVSSYSPYCSQEELSHLFEKGFRGKNAKRASDGSGIGLYFVKLLCDIHNIEININSDSKSVAQINGIPYSMFSVELHFSNVYY